MGIILACMTDGLTIGPAELAADWLFRIRPPVIEVHTAYMALQKIHRSCKTYPVFSCRIFKSDREKDRETSVCEVLGGAFGFQKTSEQLFSPEGIRPIPRQRAIISAERAAAEISSTADYLPCETAPRLGTRPLSGG